VRDRPAALTSLMSQAAEEKKMKIRRHLAAAAALLIVAAAVAEAAGSPSCGEPRTKFDVVLQKGAELPSGPTAGKALLVFFETATGCYRCELPPIRYGANGEWLGATKVNSWFAVEVNPGILSLCADWQGGFGRQKQAPGMMIFTAHAGQSYYLEAHAEITTDLVGAGIDSHNELDGNFGLSHVNAEDVLPTLRKQQLAVFKRKK